MPKIKTRRAPPPEGWNLIEDVMLELDSKMRDCASSTRAGADWRETC